MKPLYILGYALSLFMPRVASAASNTQRCFYDAGQLAPEYIIPCYSSFTSKHFSCCKVGNKCLEHSACYDAETGITYQYGCTDDNYQDENCPRKCDLDRKKTNWVGLVYCNGEENLPNNTWLCHSPDNCGHDDCDNNWDPNLQKLPPTTCEDLDRRYVAFDAPSTLSDLLALPVSTGLSSYFSAHPITTSTTSGTTLSTTSSGNHAAVSVTSEQPHSGPPATSSTQSATTSSTETSSTQGHSSMSRTVAMAVGFGAGIPTILAFVGFLLYYFRRRRNQSSERSEADTKPRGNTDIGGVEYAHKVELSGESRPLSEMPGSPVTTVGEMDGSTVGESSPRLNHSPFILPIQSEFSGKAREHRMSDKHSNQMHELPG